MSNSSTGTKTQDKIEVALDRTFERGEMVAAIHEAARAYGVSIDNVTISFGLFEEHPGVQVWTITVAYSRKYSRTVLSKDSATGETIEEALASLMRTEEITRADRRA